MDQAVSLALAAATDALISLVYAMVGYAIVERGRTPDVRRAAWMMGLWWYGIAATGLLGLLLSALARAHADAQLVDAVDQLSLLTFAGAIAGFVSHVAFIHLGSHRADRVVFPFLGALVLWSAASAFVYPATGYTVVGWRPLIERAPGWGPPPVVTVSLLLAPLVGATIAYASLYRRAAGPVARFRVALVSSSLPVWFLAVAVISIPAQGAADLVQLGARALVLVFALAILVAYRPPLVVLDWLGEPGAAEALRERRARELVRIERLI